MSSEIVSDKDLVIRRMRDHDDDYSLMAGWRNRPHVRRRWDPDLPETTTESIAEEYRPDTVASGPTVACIVELGGRPVGFVQFYRWASYADEAREVKIPFDDHTFGLDIFIGEEDMVGRGLGTWIVTLLSDHLIAALGASAVSLTTDLDNHGAIRCYEKAGFKKVAKVLDLDTYRGERQWGWLMTKENKH